MFQLRKFITNKSIFKDLPQAVKDEKIWKRIWKICIQNEIVQYISNKKSLESHGV